jgi:hypothetical protein
MVSLLIDSAQQFTSLWGGEGCGSLVIQRVSTQSLQSCLAANTHGVQFPRTDFSVFRPFPAVYLLVEGRML